MTERALAIVPQTAPPSNMDSYRASTDAATLCKQIVVETATTIQGRKYVCVEGWMAIAVAHGCTASAVNVERVEGGVRAIGQIRRMSDGTVIAEAEGFVGEDEPTWFGGQSRGKTLPRRADYAIRAMAQTRAISRACRSAFAHVVVMMNAGLATTPAEEVPYGGFDDAPAPVKAEWPEGPTPNKTKAMEAFRKVKAELSDGVTSADFERTITDNSALIAQFRIANHAWWTGQTSDGEAFESIPAWIERRRAEIAATGQNVAVKALIAGMTANTTQAELGEWAHEHGDTIDGLPDAERRQFEAAYDAHASTLAPRRANVTEAG